MKTIYAISATLVVLAFSSCAKISDLLTVEKNASISVDLPVSVAGPGFKDAPYYFNSEKLINLAEEEALVDVLSKIKSISLTEITTQILSLPSAVTFTDTYLRLSSAEDTVTWNYSSIDLQAGAFLTLANANAEYDKISSMLSALGEVKVEFAGYSNTNNIDFTVANILETTIKAGL